MTFGKFSFIQDVLFLRCRTPSKVRVQTLKRWGDLKSFFFFFGRQGFQNILAALKLLYQFLFVLQFIPMGQGNVLSSRGEGKP